MTYLELVRKVYPDVSISEALCILTRAGITIWKPLESEEEVLKRIAEVQPCKDIKITMRGR